MELGISVCIIMFCATVVLVWHYRNTNKILYQVVCDCVCPPGASVRPVWLWGLGEPWPTQSTHPCPSAGLTAPPPQLPIAEALDPDRCRKVIQGLCPSGHSSSIGMITRALPSGENEACQLPASREHPGKRHFSMILEPRCQQQGVAGPPMLGRANRSIPVDFQVNSKRFKEKCLMCTHASPWVLHIFILLPRMLFSNFSA